MARRIGRWWVGPLILALTLSALALPRMVSAASFADVAGSKYEAAVTKLADLGIVTGVDSSSYQPYQSVTRAQMAAILVRALNMDAAATASKGPTEFNDVAASGWESGYVNVAVAQGLISGYGDGRFGPTDQVTYAQAAAMLIRLLGKDEDAKAKGGWPVGYVAVSDQLGLTVKTSFVSAGVASRGDIALMTSVAVFDVKRVDGKTLAESAFAQTPAGRVARIEVTPSQLRLTKGMTQKFTATGYDAGGNVIPITPVWSLKDKIGVLGSDGSYVATASGTTSVEAAVGGIVGRASLSVSGPAYQVIAVANPVSISANGRATATITATVTDENRNPVGTSGDVINFALADSSLGTLSAQSATTTNGVATVTYTTSSRVGLQTIITSSGTLISGTAGLTLTAPVPAKIALSAEPDRMAADGISRTAIKATLIDQTGYEMSNLTGNSIVVSLINAAPSVAVLPQPTVVIQYGASSGQVYLNATTAIGSTVVSGSTTYYNLPVTPVTVTTGIVGVPKKVAVKSPTTTYAANGGTQAEVVVELQDANGYVVTGNNSAHVTLAVSSGVATVQNPYATVSGGLARFYLTSTVAGTVGVRANCSDVATDAGTGQVTFVPGPASGISLSVDPVSTIAADGVSRLTLKARIVDAYSNTVTSATMPITFVRTTSTGVINLVSNAAVTPVNGIATAEIQSTSSGGAENFKATGAGLADSNIIPVTATIVGPANRLVLSTVGSAVVGNSVSVRVEVQDALGHVVTSDNGRQVFLRAIGVGPVIQNPQTTSRGVVFFDVKDTTAENIKLWAESQGLTSDVNGVNVAFTPGPIDHIKLKASPESISADGNSVSTITAAAIDQYGNEIPTSEVLTVSVSDPAVGTLNSAQLWTGGWTSVQFKSTTATGSTTITGTSSLRRVDPVTINTYISGLPARVVVDTPVPVSAGQGETGSVMKVRVRIVDVNGNQVTSLNTGADASAVGLSVTGITGTSTITRFGGDYGLAPAGFSSNGANLGSAAVVAGMAEFNFTDTHADTVTLIPLFLYKGVQLPVQSGTGVVNVGAPARLTVTADHLVLPVGGGSSTITATITDSYGNKVSNMSDDITVRMSSADYLTLNSTTARTVNGQSQFTASVKPGAPIGSTILTLIGTVYSPAGAQVTVSVDTPPSKPTIYATDTFGMDSVLNVADTAARVVVNTAPHPMRLILKLYVNGSEVLGWSTGTGGTITDGINPNNTSVVVYIKKQDLGYDGAKDIRVMLVNDLGASPLSDTYRITVDSTH